MPNRNDLEQSFVAFARGKSKTEAYVLLGTLAGANSIEEVPDDKIDVLVAAFKGEMTDFPSHATEQNMVRGQAAWAELARSAFAHFNRRNG